MKNFMFNFSAFVRYLSYIFLLIVIILDNYSLETDLIIFTVNIFFIEYFRNKHHEIYKCCFYYLYVWFFLNIGAPYFNNSGFLIIPYPIYWETINKLKFYLIHYEQLAVIYLTLCYLKGFRFKYSRLLSISTICFLLTFIVYFLFGVEVYRSRQVLSLINSLILIYIYLNRKKTFFKIKYELLLLVAFLLSIMTITGLYVYWDLDQKFVHYIVPISEIIILLIFLLNERQLHTIFFTKKYYIITFLIFTSFLFIDSLNNPQNILIHLCFSWVFSIMGSKIFLRKEIKTINKT